MTAIQQDDNKKRKRNDNPYGLKDIDAGKDKEMWEKYDIKAILPIGCMVLLLLAAVLAFPRAYADTTNDSINIDLTGYPNPGDYPYGILCDGDPNYAFVTIFNQGLLVKIDKATKTVVSIIDDPDGPTSGGQGFYSMASDGNGNLFINEKTTGRVWKYNIAGDSWTSTPVIEQITGNPKVTYPFTYQKSPNIIQVNENPGSHGLHTYQFGTTSFGGMVYAGGNIYLGLSYDAGLDSQAQMYAGISSLKFSGLAKIDPITLTVTRIQIANSTSISGLKLEGSTIWAADYAQNKVFKLDTTTDMVTQTISLPADTNPQGLDTDNNYIYLASNSYIGNSTIVKVEKANPIAQTIIDTGVPITSSGTFDVEVIGSKLFWTDQSGHVGIIDLSTGGKIFYDTSFAYSNHNGCFVGSEFWWAATGGAAIGMLDINATVPLPPNPPNPPAPPSNSTQSGSDYLVMRHMFYEPVENCLREYLNQTIPQADSAYDYFHNGNKAYVEYVQFKTIVENEPEFGFKNLDVKQQAWLFLKMKPELDKVFVWLD